MPAIHETAYPRLKSTITQKDLTDAFTPAESEMNLATSIAKGYPARLCFLLLLKTFQRLGYFILLKEVPLPIYEYIWAHLGMKRLLPDISTYDTSGTKQRHVQIIRKHIGVKPFDVHAQSIMTEAFRESAQSKEDLTDLINMGIEELIRYRFELPGFSTLFEEAQRVRAEVNRGFYRIVNDTIGDDGRNLIDKLFVSDEKNRRSPWNTIKDDPGRPTLTQLRNLVEHMHWLKSFNVGAKAISVLPDVKVSHFAAEGKSLDAARMKEMEPDKRYTLATALIKTKVAQCLDDLGEMFIKRMRKIHHKGKESLDEYRIRHQNRTDQLIEILHDLVTLMQKDGSPEEKLNEMKLMLKGKSDQIIESCNDYIAFSDNNYFSFIWKYYKSHRKAIFALIDHLELISTSHDTSIQDAINFIIKHRKSKSDSLPTHEDGFNLDISWVPDKWWRLVTGKSNKDDKPKQIDRRQFEACLFSQIMLELKSGDLCIVGSDKYADYRDQLISWEEYDSTVDSYCEQIGLKSNSKEFVKETQTWLEETAKIIDEGFPDNNSVRIENGEPVLTKIEKRPVPPKFKVLEKLLSERIEQIGILDAISDTEAWLNWSKAFGPISGFDAKIDDHRERYVATTFCYGCNMGPAQTAKALQNIDRRQLIWINQRHVTEETLNEAITTIINAYNLFTLPKMWGSGKSASADGTKWDLYEQNLLSEYHIRYGGYGGIGYYHVSDTYIALFSHFISCGIWEAVYILDGLLKNKSEIQPDTLHADTQGQSLPVFGLAYLLAIKLMPRIRNWKDQKLFRPRKDTHYTHIENLFSENIEWDILETHLPDMLRVVLSIKTGRITASTLLRKLGTYSRKNRLYIAMKELGKVIRTIFLLQYIGDVELRQIIQAATNKSESFHNFTKWISFGGEGIITENDRDEQKKFIKYNNLVANCLIFHNVYSMTGILHQLAEEGFEIDDESVAMFSPYIMDRINRFGHYNLNLDRGMPAPDYGMSIKPNPNN